MISNLSGHDIICISCSDWDNYWAAQEQIMWRLANMNRVLFMEVPVSPLSPFTGLRRGTWMRQMKRWCHGVRQGDNPNLVIASPPPVLPFRYHKLTNSITQKILLSYVRGKANRLNFCKPLVITFQADSAALVKNIEAQAKIYYCTDDWSAWGRWWQPQKKVKERERELVQSCDIVFATSQQLDSNLRQFDKPVYFLPNAVDYRLFSQAPMLDPPHEVAGLPRPVIGFTGIMSHHSFDPALVSRLAIRNPKWSFLIVGKKESSHVDLKAVEKCPNVFFAGYKPIEKLPKYLSAMDVCLIPRVQTEWTKSAFSLKLFEYLAAGKPVVSTWSDEYLPYEDVVYLARTYEEFEKGIMLALKEDNTTLVQKRMEIAANNDWANRVLEFSKIITDFFKNRPA